MNTIERTEKIDAYLAGTMSDTENKEFEGLLLGSETSLEDRTKLQDEMELQKEIIFAIRRRGFREMVKKDIAEIKQEKEEHHRRIRRFMLGSLSVGGASFAVAAVLMLLFVITPMAQFMQAYSDQYIAAVEVSPRGNDKLTEALLLMKTDQWDEAEKIIDAVYQPTKDADFECPNQYDEAEWLKAVCLMHRGKAIRARRMLRKIANSDSDYQSRAAEILKSL